MRDRTADLLRAKQALSQLSYSPITCIDECNVLFIKNILINGNIDHIFK